MGYYYLDSSALLKYYILEPDSMWTRALVDAAEEQTAASVYTIFLADISVAEVAAGFASLHRAGRLRRATWDMVFRQFLEDVVSRYSLVTAGRDDFFEAALLTRQHPLKGYDAVQLAVALRFSNELSEYQHVLTFVSGDRTLLTSAAAEGLATDNPFEHVVPQDTPVS